MNKVFREEKKFLIGFEEFRKLNHQLEQCLHEDEHNGVMGYPIRSLYFDSIDERDYYEKIYGIETRRKIRLRCYDPDGDFAMLEMKQKQGAHQLKRSLKLSREDSIRLTKGDYSPLLNYKDPFAAECYGVMNMKCYRPKTVVEYRRKAFIAKENKIRITFDNEIVSTETSFNIFDPCLNMYPVLDPYLVVLEVKYNGFLLQYIKQMINDINRSELSVSKYCLARQHGCLARL